MKFRKLCNVGMSFLTKPYYRTRVLIKSGYYDSLSDEDFLKKVFPKYMGYPLDLHMIVEASLFVKINQHLIGKQQKLN